MNNKLEGYLGSLSNESLDKIVYEIGNIKSCRSLESYNRQANIHNQWVDAVCAAQQIKDFETSKRIFDMGEDKYNNEVRK